MPSADFAGLQSSVESMMLDGEPLHLVEAFIEAQPLAPDAKAALWLVAWVLEERGAAATLSY